MKESLLSVDKSCILNGETIHKLDPRDIVGKEFGYFKVLNVAGKNLRREWVYRCECVCERSYYVQRQNLLTGNSTNCGCVKGGNYKDISGQVFGKLTAIKIHHSSQKGATNWLCQCACGEFVVRRLSGLLDGMTFCCIKCKNRKGGGKPTTSNEKVFRQYKSSAASRKLEFNLPFNEFEKLIGSNCSYCGKSPKLSIEKKLNVPYNGIDRVDSSKGYTLDNCVTCCKFCNLAKNNLSRNDFLNNIYRIYKHSINNE